MSTTAPAIETVQVVTERKDGTTTGYLAETVDLEQYLDQGGCMTIPGTRSEVSMDVIIVTEKGEFTCKPHHTVRDCFLFIDEQGREFPLQYDYLKNGAYTVGGNFIISTLNCGVIRKIVLVTKGIMQMGVPAHIGDTRTRILEAVS